MKRRCLENEQLKESNNESVQAIHAKNLAGNKVFHLNTNLGYLTVRIS